MIHFIFFEYFLVFALLFKTKEKFNIILILSILPFLFFSFVPFSFFSISNNNLWNKDCFSFSEIIFPYNNSGLKTSFQKEKIKNLTYFSPNSKTYIWITGDGNLPCVNKKQIDFLSKKTNYIPQLITNDLKDGFYSKKVTDE